MKRVYWIDVVRPNEEGNMQWYPDVIKPTPDLAVAQHVYDIAVAVMWGTSVPDTRNPNHIGVRLKKGLIDEAEHITDIEVVR